MTFSADSTAYFSSFLQSCFVTMPDRVKLALDVLLPPESTGISTSTRHHTVLIQCRYMRGICGRWPFSLLSGRRPIDLINQDLKLALLKANYAVVSIDVRGTGILPSLALVSP